MWATATMRPRADVRDLRNSVLRFCCWLYGHPPVRKRFETIEGRVWHTETVCRCGHRAVPAFPGGAVKLFPALYADSLTEWQEIFNAQP